MKKIEYRQCEWRRALIPLYNSKFTVFFLTSASSCNAVNVHIESEKIIIKKIYSYAYSVIASSTDCALQCRREHTQKAHTHTHMQMNE